MNDIAKCYIDNKLIFKYDDFIMSHKNIINKKKRIFNFYVKYPLFILLFLCFS